MPRGSRLHFLSTLALCVTAAAAYASPAAAQAIPRDEYLKYVPLDYPRLTEQTDASRRLQIYGDPSNPQYRDEAPKDGIDDRRHDLMRDLAVRFAPYTVQNTPMAPMDFRAYWDRRLANFMVIDSWDIASESVRIDKTETVDFADSRGDDDLLRELIEEFHPLHPAGERQRTAMSSPHKDMFKVLYFDYPGEDPESWRQAYEQEFVRRPAHEQSGFLKAFVHPFVAAHPDPSDSSRTGYELALQYWLFYPYNDGGNNHEGDWEHINVVVSPRDQVGGLLDEEAIRSILAGEWKSRSGLAQELVIKRVELYFHHHVLALDYARPNVYASQAEWKREVRELPRQRIGEDVLWKRIRYLAYLDDEETRVNTHPLIFIGADNKGLDQLLTTPGSKNRDSHGSYPFPGMYKYIGPAGATEAINVFADHREAMRRMAPEGRVSTRLRRGNVVGYDRPERVELLPDWERIMGLLNTDPDVRRNYGWMVLPVRFGYPASESPFAGIVAHAETGNLSALGPAFNEGWNRVLSTPGHSLYEPHELADIFPTGIQDNFENDLGFFNATYPVLFNLPPFDFATRLVAYPIGALFKRERPVYYGRQDVPYRFVGLSGGYAVQKLDNDYQALALNARQFEEFLLRIVLHLLLEGSDSTTQAISATETLEDAKSPVYQVVFFIGDRFSSENMLRNSRSRLGFRAEFNNIAPYEYSAELNMWEYAGSLRYSLTGSRL